MRVLPFYYIMNRPVFVSEKQWYEILAGPLELEDGSFLYLAGVSGQIFPSKEFSGRRYYIRVCRNGKDMIPLDEERMGDKLYFRTTKIRGIADMIHDTGAAGGFWLNKYQFSVAKIHNMDKILDMPTLPVLPDLNAEDVDLMTMSLSVQAFKYLNRAKITNLKKLVSMTSIELEEICHGNKAVIQELYDVAARFGVYFVKLP